MNNNINMLDAILGGLYGLAIGDALGMPSRKWPPQRVRQHFGWIDTFLPCPVESEASSGHHAGKFTLLTGQSISVIEQLIEGRLPHTRLPKAADIIHRQETREAAIWLSPLGCILPTSSPSFFIEQIANACPQAYSSDIAIAGVTVVAWCLSRAIEGAGWFIIKHELPALAEDAQNTYLNSYAPSLRRRLEIAIELGHSLKHLPDGEALYELSQTIGTGTDCLESIPTALALIELAETDPVRCAHLAANIGGDTNVIGAIATAICGAMNGVNVFPAEWVETIQQANNIDFSLYAQRLRELRLR